MDAAYKRQVDAADLEQIQSLTAEGLCGSAICRRLGIHYDAVVAAQKRLGLWDRSTTFPVLNPLEIRRACEEIQREWPPEVRERRRVGGPGEWSPIVVPGSVLRSILR